MTKRQPPSEAEPSFAPRTEALVPRARAMADDPLQRLPAPRGTSKEQPRERIHKTFVLFRDTADALVEQAALYRLGVGEFTDFLLRSALGAIADGSLEVPTHAVPFQPPNYRQGGARRLPTQPFRSPPNEVTRGAAKEEDQ